MQCPPTYERLSLVTQASVLLCPAICALTRERFPGGYGRCGRGDLPCPSHSLPFPQLCGPCEWAAGRTGRQPPSALPGGDADMLWPEGGLAGGPHVPRGVQRSLYHGRESSGAMGLDCGPCLGGSASKSQSRGWNPCEDGPHSPCPFMTPLPGECPQNAVSGPQPS